MKKSIRPKSKSGWHRGIAIEIDRNTHKAKAGWIKRRDSKELTEATHIVKAADKDIF